MMRTTTTSTKTTSRISQLGAAVIGLALAFSAVGCGVPEEGDGTVGIESIQCSSIRTWQVQDSYKVGEQVQFEGLVFKCLQAHKVLAADWTPKAAASLWTKVGECSTGGAATQPPVTQPPVTQPAPPPPAPPATVQCTADGRPGPLFDPAGAKNVGNGQRQQFIGGQCLSAADCASGCCALPCGICSGPAASFQNGKQGCGFVRQ